MTEFSQGDGYVVQSSARMQPRSFLFSRGGGSIPSEGAFSKTTAAGLPRKAFQARSLFLLHLRDQALHAKGKSLSVKWSVKKCQSDFDCVRLSKYGVGERLELKRLLKASYNLVCCNIYFTIHYLSVWCHNPLGIKETRSCRVITWW